MKFRKSARLAPKIYKNFSFNGVACRVFWEEYYEIQKFPVEKTHYASCFKIIVFALCLMRDFCKVSYEFQKFSLLAPKTYKHFSFNRVACRVIRDLLYEIQYFTV